MNLDEKILEMLNRGISNKKIIEDLNTNGTRVNRVKKKYFGDKMDEKKRKSLEVELMIVEDYKNGMKTSDIAKKYNFKSNKSVTDKLKKHNVEILTSREQKMIGKDYDSFSIKEIDSDFKAYFLGIFATDGYVGKSTQIGIDLTDEDAISYISSKIGKPYSVIKRGKSDYDSYERKDKYRIVLNNKRLVDEFAERGIHNKKSLTIKGIFLSEKEEEFLKPLLRGVIDGNGWVRKDGLEFYICTASKDFVEWIIKSLEKIGMSNLNVQTNSDGVHYVRTALKENIDILKEVYNKDYGMKRKYKRIHQLNEL